MESLAQLKKRLENKLVVCEDPANILYYIDATAKGKRVANKTRYQSQPKRRALKTIQQEKQAKVDELMTLYFD